MQARQHDRLQECRDHQEREIGPLLRKKRVLARGQPAGAIVLSVSRKKKRAKVRYRFLDRSGAVVEGTDRVAGSGRHQSRDTRCCSTLGPRVLVLWGASGWA